MKEREFATNFRKELKEYCSSISKHIHLITLFDAPRSGKKPYDSYCLTSAGFCALEFKICKEASINLEAVTENQLVNMKLVTKVGGSSYAVYYVFRTKQVVFIDVWSMYELKKKYGNRVPLKDLPDLYQQGLITLLNREKCKIKNSNLTRWNIKVLVDNEII
jgi:hypothetical protein